jgi:hypothetical protein
MENKLTFLTISASFLLLGIIIVIVPMIQDKSEIETFTTTSNIIFRYGVGGAKNLNELNTFKGIFTKDMVNKAPLKTRLDLTQYELDTIYQKMVEIDFFTYPRSFQPKPEGNVSVDVTPVYIYYLEYNDETLTKIVQWNNASFAPENIQYQDLKELAHLILDIIEAKPEYKKLPKPDAGYA